MRQVGQMVDQACDANGNMIQRGTSQYLKYDAQNRLVKVSSDSNGLVYIARMAYNGDGKRAKRVDNFGAIHYAGPHYERNVGTGQNTTETVSKYYYAQMGKMKRLIAINRSGTLYYVVPDHLGGTLRTVNTDGSLVDNIRYNAFGSTRSGGTNTPTDKRFTGQTLDGYINLYFMGARYYDQQLGRFISPDTIVPNPANPQALNRYSYVTNNPLKYVDPTGHAGQDLQYLEPSWFDKQWEGKFEQEHGRKPSTEADYVGRYVGMARASKYRGEDIARNITIAMSAGEKPVGPDLWSRPVDQVGFGVVPGLGVIDYGPGYKERRWGGVRIITNSRKGMGGVVLTLNNGGDNATTFSAGLIVFSKELNFESADDLWWLEHELWHVRQAQQEGVRYLPTYLGNSIQNDHAHNPMEIAANGFANQGGTGVVRWD